MRTNAATENFERVTVFGQPMLFTCLRVDRKTVPEGYFMYEIRHDDEGHGDPVEIANWIMVNHWGTLISNRPIRLTPNAPLNNNAYRHLEDADWNYEGIIMPLAQYMRAYPPTKKPC